MYQARCKAIEASADAQKLKGFPIVILMCTRSGWQASIAGIHTPTDCTNADTALDLLVGLIARHAALNSPDALARTLGIEVAA